MAAAKILKFNREEKIHLIMVQKNAYYSILAVKVMFSWLVLLKCNDSIANNFFSNEGTYYHKIIEVG